MGPGGRLDLKDPGLKDPGPMGPGAQGAPQAIGGPRAPQTIGGPKCPQPIELEGALSYRQASPQLFPQSITSPRLLGHVIKWFAPSNSAYFSAHVDKWRARYLDSGPISWKSAICFIKSILIVRHHLNTDLGEPLVKKWAAHWVLQLWFNLFFLMCFSLVWSLVWFISIFESAP